jgi:hypothetical protein
LALRDDTQKHSVAIQKANERKATVQEACRLFKSYLYAAAKFIRGLEDNSRTCGVPADAIKQAREGHAKASQVGKQVCDAAAQGPRPAGPNLFDAQSEDFRKPDQSRHYEDGCRDCDKTGDFWWPGDRMPGRRSCDQRNLHSALIQIVQAVQRAHRELGIFRIDQQ